MARIDWSVLSGPRVSRRTLIAFAASGAPGYASRLDAVAAPLPSARITNPRLAQGEPVTGGTLHLGFGISQIPNLDPAKVNLEDGLVYAFLHHTIDTTGFHTDVQGYLPVPEMRYLEHVWLDR